MRMIQIKSPRLASTLEGVIGKAKAVPSWWEKRALPSKGTIRTGPDTKEVLHNSEISNQDILDGEQIHFTSGLEMETSSDRKLKDPQAPEVPVAENEICVELSSTLPKRTPRSLIKDSSNQDMIACSNRSSVTPRKKTLAAISFYGKDSSLTQGGCDDWHLHEFLYRLICNYAHPCEYYSGRSMKHRISCPRKRRKATPDVLQRRGIITTMLFDCDIEIDLERVIADCGNQSPRRHRRKTGDRRRKVTSTLQRRGNLTTALLDWDREKYSEHNLNDSGNQLRRHEKKSNRTQKRTNTLQRRGCINTALLGYDGDIYSGPFWNVQESRCFASLAHSHHSLPVFVD